MNWKQYKSLPPEKKQDETYYIIGLDIGSESSGIAFFNLLEGIPETIDLSGGYGKPSIPTVMQYIPETKEWVFGEYAILNQGAGTEITLKSLAQRLGSFDYIEVGRKDMSVASILGLFIKELLGNVRNINPKAEIVGIVAAIPEKLGQGGQEELTRAFKLAGYEKELIALVPSRECILANHYRNRLPQDEKVLLLDYGSREVRGGVYQVQTAVAQSDSPRSPSSQDPNSPNNQNPNKPPISAIAMSSLFNEKIGTSNIWTEVYGMFETHYHSAVGSKAEISPKSQQNHSDTAKTSPTPPEHQQQLNAFTYQHKDILFQKNIRSKPAKLYYNFVYPPFQKEVTHADVGLLIKPYQQQFSRLISDTLEKNTGTRPIPLQEIDAVLCVGGGFEMLWAREAVAAAFGQDKNPMPSKDHMYNKSHMYDKGHMYDKNHIYSKVQMYRNSKLATAEGAAFVAAVMLEACEGNTFKIEDTHQLIGDIGIRAGDVFLPLAERDTFWWQPHKPKLVLVNSKIDGELGLSIAQRTPKGEQVIASHTLTGLPKRPKGTTRLEFGLDFKSNTRMILKVSDIGFGELFPKTGYKQELAIQLA